MIREVEEETGMLVQAKGLADIDSFYSEHEDHAFHWLRIIYQTELMGGKLSYEVDGSTDYCAWWTFEESQALDLVELAKHGLKLAFPQQNEA